jgi:hypothetical protein
MHSIATPKSFVLCCPAGAGLLGRGELYVVGGGMYSSLLVRLDAAAGCWHSCEGPRTPRLHAAVAGASGEAC